MDPRAHRESAHTSDPADVADKAARIRQILDHSRRQRLHELTTPIRAAERFAAAEQQAEDEKFR